MEGFYSTIEPSITVGLLPRDLLCASVVEKPGKHSHRRHKDHEGCTEDFKLGYRPPAKLIVSYRESV